MKVFVNVKERSDRVPRKNFRELGGVPLWKRCLDRYRDHDVYVDTDSAEILDRCASDPSLRHVTAYARCQEHADDPEPGLAMLYRFLEERVSDECEPVALVNVTAPFLRAETVERAVSRMDYGRHDSALSVTVERNFAYREEAGRYIPVNHDGRSWPRTQDLAPVMFPSHGFYVVRKGVVERLRHRVGVRPLMVEVGFPESLDIDWESDWRLAVAVHASGEP